VILVRHAELQGAAMADPKSLPLSPDGKVRAQRLAGMLKDSGIAAIYVTDFARTNQNRAAAIEGARPAAHGRPRRAIRRNLVERLRKNHAGQVVLLVGHTDTLPGLIKALGVPSDIKIEPQDYGNLFVVTPRGEGAPGFLRLRY